MKGQSEIAYLPKFANMMLIVMVIVITEILYIILIFDCFEKSIGLHVLADDANALYPSTPIRPVLWPGDLVIAPVRGFWSWFGGVCSLTYCNGNFRVTMVSEPFNVIL